ncbi:hypothetical protein [Spirosoma utsteinense]|uniref:Uncharacterized protein n=1 Tax=Spirosoma utsteinense TaxID=2585773 RepID=A0ABR6WEW1_9BACT|nr:hypothetical protein [Spirosoma utsteinense]MBC3789154.1 hypothetical protein [Spirosoma utsteinense]MBC3795074.1 hypothetical protein [Spirosoma utsteinense]
MENKEPLEPIPPIQPGANSYNPKDIRRWGVKRFLDEVCPKEPFMIPDLGFTDEENRRMDEALDQERQATADGK